MSGIVKQIVAALAVSCALALFVGAGNSISSADEPKAPKPQNVPPSPQLPFTVPGEFGRAQEQFRRAMESLTKNPNDPAAQEMLGAAWAEMMKGFPGGPIGFPGLVTPAPSERPRLGVQIAPLTPLIADQLSLDKGVAIAGVLDGSVAAKAGFKTHDILVEFAGQPVSDPAEFVRRVGEAKTGAKVDAVVVRKGKRVELKGIELPEAAPRAEAFGLPLNPQALEKGRSGDTVAVSVSGDAFTIDATQDGVGYRITGTVGPNGVTAEKVSIKAGAEAVEGAEPGKVPEKYRATVDRLLKLVGKSRGKVVD